MLPDADPSPDCAPSVALVPKADGGVQKPKALVAYLQGCRYCIVCARVRSSAYAHKNRSGHALRPLTPEERREVELDWVARQEQGVSAKSAQAEHQRAVHGRDWAPPSAEAAIVKAEALVSFGKYPAFITNCARVSKHGCLFR